MRRISETLIILFTASVALSGCANEKIWGGNIITFDEDSEIEKGTEQHKRILEQVGAYNDTKLSAYVETVGAKIASVSDRPNLQWHFTVLDSATPNAFATQGGYVYITRGMLVLLQSDAELSAILSHETAHICARDTLRAQRAGNMMELGVLGMIVAAPALLLVPQLAVAPAGAGMAAISRKDELNADRLGAVYLQRAGFPPETMQAAMDMLTSMEAYEQEQNKTAGKTSQWWHRVYASHPTTEKRQEKLAEITNHTRSETAIAPQPGFLAHLNGIEFGSAKLQGIPYGPKQYFPQWKLALEVPEGWFVYMNKGRNQLWLARPDWKARLLVEQTTTINTERPCETLVNQMMPSTVTETKTVHEHGAPSCTGLAHKTVPTLFSHRDTVLRAGVVSESKAAGFGYIFRGYADENAFTETDPVFLSIAQSIESIQATEVQPKPLSLKIRRAKTGETFTSLAHNSRFKDKNAESLLRLLNRRYPDGEPQAGELIKIIE